MSDSFPSDTIEDERSRALREKREQEGDLGSVFQAWNRLNRALVQTLPEGLARAERSRRRLARLR